MGIYFKSRSVSTVYTFDIANYSHDPLLSSCLQLQTVSGNKRLPKRKSAHKTLINLLTLVSFRIGNILASLPVGLALGPFVFVLVTGICHSNIFVVWPSRCSANLQPWKLGAGVPE